MVRWGEYKAAKEPEEPAHKRFRSVRELLNRTVPMDFRVGSWPLREGDGHGTGGKPPRGCFPGSGLIMLIARLLGVR